MATLSLGNKTIFTQSGSNDPVMSSDVNLTNADMSNANIKTSFSSLDTSASQGPTTDLTNTTLPIFACRAWVNFDGSAVTTVSSEDHCQIFSSGNVNKIVRTATGEFKIVFEIPMPDSNYCIVGSCGYRGSANKRLLTISDYKTTQYFGIETTLATTTGANENVNEICLVVFR